MCFFFFQAEDGIRDLVRSRGLGDVYKRQDRTRADCFGHADVELHAGCTGLLEHVLNEHPERDVRDHSFGVVDGVGPVSYTHLRAHETVLDLVCRLLLEKKKKDNYNIHNTVDSAEQQQP